MILEEMAYLFDAEEFMPKKVYIEPTSRCNLNCSICFRHGWFDEKLGEMDMTTFEKVACEIGEIPTVREVFFGGMGEPLFNKSIVDMVALLPKALKVSLLTNGTMLSKELSERLIEAGLSELWISMDGFDKESYESIQLGSRFDLICSNISAFNEARKGTDVTLGITFVVTHDNINHLDKINAFADKFGADILNISHMITGEPVKEEELLALYNREDIPVGKMHRFEYRKDEVRENICPFIDNKCTFIRWDAKVTPCMQLLHNCYTYLYEEKRKITSFSYGCVKEQSLLECWNNQDYKDFRERVGHFYFPFCRVCWGCEDRKENLTDCLYGEAPTCGACLWASGKVFCP